MEDLANGSVSKTFVKQARLATTLSPLPGLITMETRITLDYAATMIGAFIICLFGIASNVVNIIVFYKQGLDNTMNISFFTLAISDLGSLVTLTWTFLCLSPPLYTSKIPLDFPNIQYLSSGWPHLCFGNITCWITAYITGERCLCIALPLKVKQIITPRRTTTIIIVIYVVNIVSIIPDYFYCYFDWEFMPERNQTVFTLTFRKHLNHLEGDSFLALGILGFISFPIVVIFTIILVVRLKRQASWREKTTGDQSQMTTKREIKTMTMVVLIAFVLILCYIPSALVSTTTFVVPSFTAKGRYANMWFVAWDYAIVAHGINSSVNIFLYYRMSTKFKSIFHQLFYCCNSPASGGDTAEQR